MNYTEVLEKYLYRIARDELSDIDSVLPLLRKATIFVLGKAGNEDDESRVDLFIPLRKKSGVNLVPVFLANTRNFQPQPYGEYDFFEIPGESLLQVLPPNYGIIIEPMTSLEVLFTPEMLGNGTSPAQPSDNLQTRNDSKVRYLNPLDSKQPVESGSADDSSFDTEMSFDLFGTSDIRMEDEPGNGMMEVSRDDDEKIRIRRGRKKSWAANPESGSVNSYEIEARLVKLVRGFDAIQEAYSITQKTAHSEWVLGVLAEPWGSDDRFRLIESVARISQEFYGYAGAIEVYDDLNDTHSKSWELFKMIPPFYSRDIDVASSSLLSNIEKLDEKPGIKESVSKLTKSGFRLFGR